MFDRIRDWMSRSEEWSPATGMNEECVEWMLVI